VLRRIQHHYNSELPASNIRCERVIVSIRIRISSCRLARLEPTGPRVGLATQILQIGQDSSMHTLSTNKLVEYSVVQREDPPPPGCICVCHANSLSAIGWLK